MPSITRLKRLRHNVQTQEAANAHDGHVNSAANKEGQATNSTPNDSSGEQQSDTPPAGPPDGGRTAWTQVVASFLINMNVYGLVNAFGEFQHFYETKYLATYSSSTISWIGTVQGSLTLFIGAVSGPIFDAGYFMITLRCAALALVVSWMLLSVSDQYYQVRRRVMCMNSITYANTYQIMLTQGVLAGICVGLMEVPSIALIPDYFRKRLGLALGLGICGAPAGGLIYSAVFRAVLTAAGFGWATRTIGFIVFVTLGIAILIIKPKDADRKAKDRKFFELGAFREAPFLLTFLDAFFAYCAALVPYFVTPAFAVAVSLIHPLHPAAIADIP